MNPTNLNNSNNPYGINSQEDFDRGLTELINEFGNAHGWNSKTKKLENNLGLEVLKAIIGEKGVNNVNVRDLLNPPSPLSPNKIMEGNRNFISYAYRAFNNFDDKTIRKQIRNHFNRLEALLMKADSEINELCIDLEKNVLKS